MKKTIVIGNWKMQLSHAESIALAKALSDTEVSENMTVIVCPSSPSLDAVRAALPVHIALGAQDAHWATDGAFTGAVSPTVLKELGVSHVIVGHSERRDYFGETDNVVAGKVLAVTHAGMTPVLCVGETKKQRDNEEVDHVVTEQVQIATEKHKGGLIIAYEPVWAIGTGHEVEAAEAGRVAAVIAKVAPPNTPILYGGSVTAENVRPFIAESSIDGILVGGASQHAASFIALMRAL